jgi:hypothetical protein
MGKKLILMGLVEPETEDLVEAFNEWYLGNHIEDTYNCPNITAVRSFKAVRGFLGEAPSGYLTIYEFEGDDAAEAERILAEYQSDPNAYPAREPSNGSMKVVGAGWYEEAVAFGT